MEQLNPEIKQNYITNDDKETTDVKMVQNLKTTALLTAQLKVNTQEEFKQAFENWFGELGVANKYKDNFNSTTAINHIREIFKKFNIKM
jgi:uncharacterized protein YfdQ (DUF2303 family)